MRAGEVGALLGGAIFYAAFGGENRTTGLLPVGKPYNRPGGRWKCTPFGGWRHHLARWEAYHWILSRLRLLANQVPLPPGGKHVTGFAGRGAPL